MTVYYSIYIYVYPLALFLSGLPVKGDCREKAVVFKGLLGILDVYRL